MLNAFELFNVLPLLMADQDQSGPTRRKKACYQGYIKVVVADLSIKAYLFYAK